MFPAPFPVVLDANVLFPMTLRDTLLRAASEGMYQVHWSARICEEAARNLVRTGRMIDAQAERLITIMNRAFPEASVTGFEHLVPAMPNDPRDRHVAAAAVKAGAQVIVTNNLRDFRALPPGIEAQSPDEFLCHLFDLDPARMVELVRKQARDLKRPPRTFEDVVAALAKSVPRFAEALLDEAGA